MSGAGADASSPRFFASAAAFRKWLETNHDRHDAFWIAFWKTHTGRKGLTYLEAVEEALCFGWIDGLKKRLDENAFVHRFTPRRARSIWSQVNLRKVEALIASGRMAAPGRAAYESRDRKRVQIYSFEQRVALTLDPALERRFRSDAAARKFFAAQPPGYRRVAVHWVMSAKKAETRERRLDRLSAASARGLRLPHLAGSKRAPDRG